LGRSGSAAAAEIRLDVVQAHVACGRRFDSSLRRSASSRRTSAEVRACARERVVSGSCAAACRFSHRSPRVLPPLPHRSHVGQGAAGCGGGCPRLCDRRSYALPVTGMRIALRRPGERVIGARLATRSAARGGLLLLRTPAIALLSTACSRARWVIVCGILVAMCLPTRRRPRRRISVYLPSSGVVSAPSDAESSHPVLEATRRARRNGIDSPVWPA
jgi:hypothetical protein